jgi:hypothetical protein
VKYSDGQIVYVSGRLGISPKALARALSNEEDLQTLKSKVQHAYKELALLWHPDRTHEDPQKSQLFQLATELATHIQQLTTVGEAVTVKRASPWKFNVRVKVTAGRH